MKALLLSAYRDLEVAEIPTPTPGPDEVLVQVAACGICGSDVHGYDGSTGRRIPPMVMGHEAAGLVIGLGDRVSGISKGDRVTFDSTIYCGTCDFCVRGEINLCDRREVLGVSCSDYRRAGAFAEYVAVPARIVYRLPDQLSFAEAALLEAVAVALHAVSLTPVGQDSSTLVVGAGMIGLLILHSLRAAGVSRILVVDVDKSRLKLAAKAGATTICMADSASLARIAEFSSGRGVDTAIEAVGKSETVTLAIESVRKGGSVTLVGNVSSQVALPLQKVVTRQIRLQGSCASAGEYPRAIELVAGEAIPVKALITAIAPLEEGPTWFERLYAREPNLMKVVLTPGTIP